MGIFSREWVPFLLFILGQDPLLLKKLPSDGGFLGYITLPSGSLRALAVEHHLAGGGCWARSPWTNISVFFRPWACFLISSQFLISPLFQAGMSSGYTWEQLGEEGGKGEARQLQSQANIAWEEPQGWKKHKEACWVPGQLSLKPFGFPWMGQQQETGLLFFIATGRSGAPAVLFWYSKPHSLFSSVWISWEIVPLHGFLRRAQTSIWSL